MLHCFAWSVAPVLFVAMASTRDAEDCMKLQFALDACDHADPFLDTKVVPILAPLRFIFVSS